MVHTKVIKTQELIFILFCLHFYDVVAIEEVVIIRVKNVFECGDRNWSLMFCVRARMQELR